MAKEIMPLKLIIKLNKDGTFKDGVLVYQIKNDTSVSKRDFYTVGIKNGIQISDLEKIIIDCKTHTEIAENITKEMI